MKSLKYQAKMIILFSIITTYNLIKVLYIWMNLTKKNFRFNKKISRKLKNPSKNLRVKKNPSKKKKKKKKKKPPKNPPPPNFKHFFFF